VVGPDPRIAEQISLQAMQDELSPRMSALVPSTPTGPHECQDLMALDFKSHYFQAFAYVPTYSQFLLEADLVPTYRYERRVLQLLQWGQPTRPWRLKCPSHLLWLDDLDVVFPDANFVMTHRDPTEVMVSVSDVYAEVGRQFNDELDLAYLGRLNVRHWTFGMANLLEFRDARGDDRFYDMDFRAVQRDPIGEVQALYDWLGEPVTEPFEQGMQRWWAEHAAQRETNIHPDASEFSLDLDGVRTQFAPYTARIAGWVERRRGA
jgi:hypothetical protein